MYDLPLCCFGFEQGSQLAYVLNDKILCHPFLLYGYYPTFSEKILKLELKSYDWRVQPYEQGMAWGQEIVREIN